MPYRSNAPLPALPWILLTLAPSGLAGAPVFDLWAGWESQYISEGRRALEASGGIITGTLAASTDDWFLEAWNAVNPHHEFWELDATVGYGIDFGRLSATLGYTLVKVWIEDGEHKPDHEVFAGLAYALGESTEVAADLVWSHLTRGAYGEVSIIQALPVPGAFEWLVYGTVAVDFGYASEDFDGLCHAVIGTECRLLRAEGWSAGIFLNLILPFEDVDRAGGNSLVYGGMSLGGRF